MEELYESDVMWPEIADRPITDAAGGGGSYGGAAVGRRAAPVAIPAARRREAGGGGTCEEEPSGEMVPPHVLASRGRVVGEVAFSLCSGKGRKLKGRDLRRVRDSVLRMTGYLE